MPIADLPQSNRQHAVPQNIMDVEFKLIGSLTMRQFSYLLVFGLVAYVSFITVGGIFKWPVTVFFTALGLGLAFVPVGERGLDEWLINLVNSIYSPTQRVWKKEPKIPSVFLYQSIAVVKQEMIALAPTSSRRKLEKYLDYGIGPEEKDPLDIPEAEYALKVKEAFIEVAEVSLPVPSAPVAVAVMEPEEEFIEKVSEEVLKVPEEEPKEPEKMPIETPEEPEPVEKTEPVKPKIVEYLHPIHKTPTAVAPKKVPIRQEAYVSVSPMTPDRHSGRTFTQLLPSRGEIFLPIRGERVLKTSEELQMEESVDEKVQKLRMLLDQIRQDRDIPIPTSPVQQVQPLKTAPVVVAQPVVQKTSAESLSKQAKDAVADLKRENQRLAQEISKLRTEVQGAEFHEGKPTGKEALLKRLEMQKSRAQTGYEALHKQVAELQKQIQGRGVVSPVGKREGIVHQYPVYKSLTSKPNVVSGVVKSDAGRVLGGVLLIVKDSKGSPVRAFKTNKIGEFVLSTPLEQGMYTIEVSPVNDLRLSFDIISVEVKGTTIPPIEMIGKQK